MEGDAMKICEQQPCRRDYTISEIWSKYQIIDFSDSEDFQYGLDRCGFNQRELIMLIEMLTIMRND